MKHTSAPWRLNRYGQEQILHTEPSGRVYIICTLKNHSEQGLADSKLICAAPEMLETLKEVESTLDWILYTAESSGVYSTLQKVQEIIKKAEG